MKRSTSIFIGDTKLWSPDSPHLYELEVADLIAPASDAVTERDQTYFGMRKISLGKDEKGIQRLC